MKLYILAEEAAGSPPARTEDADRARSRERRGGRRALSLEFPRLTVSVQRAGSRALISSCAEEQICLAKCITSHANISFSAFMNITS